MTAERYEVYECKARGNIVEVLRAGKGDLVSCGQPMTKLVVNTVDASKEKHYIEWIELFADGKEYRQYLKPGAAPEAIFNIKATNVTAREHCNLHGLWEGK